LGIGGAALAAALATAVLATVGALIAQIVHVTDPMAYLASLGAIVAACLLAAWIPLRVPRRSIRFAPCDRNKPCRRRVVHLTVTARGWVGKGA
jgi:hypothetical protein